MLWVHHPGERSTSELERRDNIARRVDVLDSRGGGYHEEPMSWNWKSSLAKQLATGLIVVLLLVATGCAGVPAGPATSPAPSPTTAPTDTLAPSATPTEEPATATPAAVPTIPGPTETYGDEEVGFAIDYPAGWYTQTGQNFILTSFKPAEAGQGGIPEGATKIDVVPPAHPDLNQPLDEMVEQVKSEDSEVLWEEEWTLPGGVPAVRLQIRSEMSGVVAVLLTRIHDTSLRVAGYGDLTLFDAIARTLRPVPRGTPEASTTPGPPAEADCADVEPFAPGCLDQPAPATLQSAVAFVGVVPGVDDATAAAWSPDGQKLAYAWRAESDAVEGVAVRSLPDFSLESRWPVSGVSDLTWTPDGQRILFIFDRDVTTSIGLARLGQDDWRDLLPGEKAQLAVSGGKNFVNWPAEDLLAFTVHCGTGCQTLYTLELASGELNQLAVFGQVAGFGTEYLFNADHRWLAINNWGRGIPFAKVLGWPTSGEPVDLSARLDDRPTAAQSWHAGKLAFVAFPPGDPNQWSDTPAPDLYVWDSETGEMQRVASGVFGASFSPAGDRLAALFAGEPALKAGIPQSDGTPPYLALLSWPEGELIATTPVSDQQLEPWDLLDAGRYLPVVAWSPQGEALAFSFDTGSLALMRRDGTTQTVVSGKFVSWAGWGAAGHLAMLAGEEQFRGREIWIARLVNKSTS